MKKFAKKIIREFKGSLKYLKDKRQFIQFSRQVFDSDIFKYSWGENIYFDIVKNALISTGFGKTIKAYITDLEKIPGYHDIANEISNLSLQYLYSLYDKDEAIEKLKNYYVKWIYTYLKEYLNFKETFQYSGVEKGFSAINQHFYQNPEV